MSPAFGLTFLMLFAAAVIWLCRDRIAEWEYRRHKWLREKVHGAGRHKSEHASRPLDPFIGAARELTKLWVPTSLGYYQWKAKLSAVIVGFFAVIVLLMAFAAQSP